MSALKNCEVGLKKYLLAHRLPDIFESLLTALAVNQPEDGRLFILEKIKSLQHNPELLEKLRWDTFIDENRRPSNRMKNFDFLWSYEDENSQPTLEMLEKAYSFYNQKLLKVTFGYKHDY